MQVLLPDRSSSKPSLTGSGSHQTAPDLRQHQPVRMNRTPASSPAQRWDPATRPRDARRLRRWSDACRAPRRSLGPRVRLLLAHVVPSELRVERLREYCGTPLAPPPGEAPPSWVAHPSTPGCAKLDGPGRAASQSYPPTSKVRKRAPIPCPRSPRRASEGSCPSRRPASL